MSASASELLASFACETNPAAVPDEVAQLVVQHLIDTVGNRLASVGTEATVAVERVTSQAGPCTAIGRRQQLVAEQAALVNGTLARAQEFDDMAMPDLHPSGVLVPAVLAAAEEREVSGAAVVSALTVGLELLLRIGRAGTDVAARNSGFLANGLDASALCGTMAGAAAIAALTARPATVVNAMGIALSLASGSLESNRSGGTVKQLQSGFAARAALQAVQLAEAGILGPREALEGRYGFYRCFAGGTIDVQMLTGELGQRWEISSLRYKPYPCNYYTHAGIDASLACRDRGIEPRDVVSVRQLVAEPMLRTMGAPLQVKQRPPSGYAGRFSGPYTVAAAWIGGTGLGLGLEDFSDAAVRRPDVLDLSGRVTVVADPACDRVFPDQAPCVLEIELIDGSTVREEVWQNRGSAQRPLSTGEVAEKFRSNATRSMPEPTIEPLYDRLRNLSSASDVSAVTALLREAAPASS